MIPQLTPEQLIQAAALFIFYAEGCVPYVNEEIFPGRIFWLKDGKYHFEYNKKFPDSFWVCYSIWVNFKEKFNLNYEQTSDLLKPAVEEAFKLGQLTPYTGWYMNMKKIEEAFKLGKLTPMKNAQQPKKGEYMGECYRFACSNTPAMRSDLPTKKFYFIQCAQKINAKKHGAIILCNYKEPFWKIEANSWRTDYAYCPEDNQYLAVTQYYNTFGPSLVFCKAPESHTNLMPSDAETFYSNYRKTVSEMFRLIPLNTPTSHAAANEENTARNPE